MNTADALRRFADDLQAAGRSPRTAIAYIQAITRVLSAMELFDDGWGSFTPIDLAEWRRQRAAIAKPATVNLEVDALRQFYRWAVGEGLLPADRKVSSSFGQIGQLIQ